MGNWGSSYTDEPNNNLGLIVKEVAPNSPGEKCGLVAREDYIVTVDGRDVRGMQIKDIKAFVQASEGTPIEFDVFNKRTKDIREVTLHPSRDWPGDGLLGIVIRVFVENDRILPARTGPVVPPSPTSATEGEKKTRRLSAHVDFSDVYTDESPVVALSRSMSRTKK